MSTTDKVTVAIIFITMVVLLAKAVWFTPLREDRIENTMSTYRTYLRALKDMHN